MTTKNKAFQVLLAQAGNRDALDKILQSIQDPIYCYLRKLLISEADAEEALQEVFLLIFRKLKHLKDPLLFNSWAYRIATRAAMAQLKKNNKWKSEELIDEFEYESEQDLQKILEIKLDLNVIIPNLPSAAKAVFILHQVQGFKLIEISEILGIPIGTVKSRLAYANKAVRDKYPT